MRIAVLGAGSWGTTVASLLAGRHDCTVWARDPELAREIYERDANSRYLAGFTLPSALKATADLEKAVHDVDLLVVGVPTHGFRAILADARPYLRPWIPVVSLAERHGVEMPVCNEVYRVLTGEIHASEAYRGLTPYYQAGHEREPG